MFSVVLSEIALSLLMVGMRMDRYSAKKHIYEYYSHNLLAVIMRVPKSLKMCFINLTCDFEGRKINFHAEIRTHLKPTGIEVGGGGKTLQEL